MKRSITYRIVALTLASLVFLSTSMHSMSLHFCGGAIAGIGLFDQVKTNSNCCSTDVAACEVTTSSEDGCCKDEFINLQWDTDIAAQSEDAIIDTDQRILMVMSYASMTVNSPQSTTTPQSYIPPLLPEKRSVLFQQFLI